MDEDTRASLTEIKTDVRQGFADVKQEIKELVTRGEFNATVQRLDAQHDMIRRDFTAHEEAAPAHRQAAMDRVETVRKEVNSTIWKAVTLAVAGAGVLVSVINWVSGYVAI